MPNSTKVPLNLASLLAARIILRVFRDLGRYKVRVHSGIARQDWAKLWYLLRGLDEGNCGNISIPIEELEILLGVSQATIYRWLLTGKKCGAFRGYKITGGILRAYMGKLWAVAKHFNLRRWGVTARVTLADVAFNLKATATRAVTEKLQQRSRYAANRLLAADYRRNFGAPAANELVAASYRQSSHDTATGQVPFLLHISSDKLFVRAGFIAYGTSQDAISLELGIHTRTVQRHQKQLGMWRRQLCQRRLDYGGIRCGWREGAEEYYPGFNELDRIGYKVRGDMVYFTDGIPGCATKSNSHINRRALSKTRSEEIERPNSLQRSWHIPIDKFGQRFFVMGGETWLAKCNIYGEELGLSNMRASQRKYWQWLEDLAANCHSDTSEKIEPSGGFPDLQVNQVGQGYKRHF